CSCGTGPSLSATAPAVARRPHGGSGRGGRRRGDRAGGCLSGVRAATAPCADGPRFRSRTGPAPQRGARRAPWGVPAGRSLLSFVRCRRSATQDGFSLIANPLKIDHTSIQPKAVVHTLAASHPQATLLIPLSCRELASLM